MAAQTLLLTMKNHLMVQGESLQHFAADWKTLTKQDRDDYRRLFKNEGIYVIPEEPVSVPLM